MERYNYTPSTLMLVGGVVDQFDFADWDFTYMTFAVVEHVVQGTEIMRTADINWQEFTDWLTRVHIFGQGGDLTIRRDEQRCYWRYVGQPIANLGGTDFWQAHPDISELRAEPAEALLWGRYNEKRGRWYAARVGKAKLNYPVPDTPTMVLTKSIVLKALRTGTVAAVWTYSLEAAPQETFGEHKNG